MNRRHGDSYSSASEHLHTTALLVFLLITFGSAAYPSLAEALTFTDDFNRPDSTTVGNGWSNTEANVNGNLEIRNNELTSTSTIGGGAGIFRPFAFTAPLTVTATLKEMNGFGGLLRRYVTSFLVRSDGTRGHGYGVVVVRSDQNFDNSQVILVEDNTQLASIPSTFQYGPEIRVSVTFNLDGSVTGIVSEPAPSTNTFSFSFGPHAIQSTGNNFSITTDFADSRTSTFTFPRIDNVSITSAAQEVNIDIKPGSFPNSINPHSQGAIPVAILTTDATDNTNIFDATMVDPTTVRFGRTGTEAAPVHDALGDVDGDGDTDMILHFNTQDTGIECGDISASLTGETFDGQAVEGSDSIRTVRCN